MDHEDHTSLAVLQQKQTDIDRRLTQIESNLRWLTMLVAASVIGALLRMVGLG
jgi:hypothetical protein